MCDGERRARASYCTKWISKCIKQFAKGGSRWSSQLKHVINYPKYFPNLIYFFLPRIKRQTGPNTLDLRNIKAYSLPKKSCYFAKLDCLFWIVYKATWPTKLYGQLPFKIHILLNNLSLIICKLLTLKAFTTTIVETNCNANILQQIKNINN